MRLMLHESERNAIMSKIDDPIAETRLFLKSGNDIPVTRVVIEAKELASLIQKYDHATDENTALRKLLWMYHGHRPLYGDDEEMQCHGYDFKQDPVEQLFVHITATAIHMNDEK